MRPLDVTVCGGGRTGHLNAVLFSRQPGVRVSWLTSNPEVVGGAAGGLVALLPDGSTLRGEPSQVGTDPASAVRHADVVVLTVPAHARAAMLRTITPYLHRDKPVHVGAIPGFCGFDWLAEEALAGRPNAVIWGMKDVPHTAFDLVPGRSVRMGGAKRRLHVALHRRESPEAREALASHLARLFEAPVEMLRDYLEITLTPGNPIMHSAVIYGLVGPYGQWRDRPLPEGFCWWTDCPELGAYFLERSDEENQRLRRAAEARLAVDLSSVKPLKTEIVEAYGDQIADASTMLSVLRTNRAYEAIRAPLVHDAAVGGPVLDRTSRAFREDVVYGLGLLVRMAERLDVRTPYLDEIHRWALGYMGGAEDPLSYVPQAWAGAAR
ncbi:hypothetical protein VQ02_24570 [Methylobacterium variabile]|jgi:opine dehydrogenase|uniref:Opine dehydrogenase domain-containing protein n=1 Tax=Methylobacterium variabile TaxID=298794 RepID=A0A0J6SEH5_9HYPH|nr:NAD/NADP octopine/nopaline dehydrogenase family protein [Methylobacterium variabile]KMO32082.1 hypothetical protein VQ02_24570 [Methylobacterium variabile]